MNNIFRSFKCCEPDFLTRAFTTYVRPLLESSTEVWNPTTPGLIAEIESVQRQFTRRVFARARLPKMDYESRLSHLGISLLKIRRDFRDIEFVFKTVHSHVLYDSSSLLQIAPLNRVLRNTHPFRLRLPFDIPGQRRSTCASRSIVKWNELPEENVSDPSLTRFRLRMRIT